MSQLFGLARSFVALAALGLSLQGLAPTADALSIDLDDTLTNGVLYDVDGVGASTPAHVRFKSDSSHTSGQSSLSVSYAPSPNPYPAAPDPLPSSILLMATTTLDLAAGVSEGSATLLLGIAIDRDVTYAFSFEPTLGSGTATATFGAIDLLALPSGTLTAGSHQLTLDLTRLGSGRFAGTFTLELTEVSAPEPPLATLALGGAAAWVLRRRRA